MRPKASGNVSNYSYSLSQAAEASVDSTAPIGGFDICIIRSRPMPSKGNFSSRRLGRAVLIAMVLVTVFAAGATGSVRKADPRLPTAFEPPQPAAAAIAPAQLDRW